MNRLLVPLLLAIATPATAIVIRHDVDAARYALNEGEFAALVDLPQEGHGVLIAPQWIVTAAHAVQGQTIQAVMLNGEAHAIERLVVHPGFKPLPHELLSGDAAPAMRWQAASDDIALIKLAAPVRDIAPLPLYRGSDERGRIVQLLGKGATGNGRDGLAPHAPHRGALRRAFNVVDTADARWLGCRFDDGAAAHRLEGLSGSGDSGGPLLVEQGGEWQLAGLTAWIYYQGKIDDYRAGVYGLTGQFLRLSRYADWIDRIIAEDAVTQAEPGH